VDAIVLVGGQGTRLRPLTLTRHKSLVPVCNRPFIEYLFDWLERAGMKRVVLALGQDNGDLARAYPASRIGGMELAIVTERERMESGGAIRHAVHEAAVEGRFVVLNGDVFVEFDFGAMLAQHEQVGARLSQYLYPVSEPWRYGVAVVDQQGMITGFVEKPPMGEEPGNLVNAGVWIFEPELVAMIPPGPVRVEETLFPSLVARRHPVLGFQGQGIWADIGTPRSYLELNTTLLEREGTSAIATQATIQQGARIARSSVGAACVVMTGARVEASILWENVSVGAGAAIRGSILANGVRVGDGARMEGAVLGAGSEVAAAAVVPPGTVIEPGGRYDADNG
jgi:mannose-1-phosphate guanylyltransferase